jgi:hypothetical protein
MNEIATLPASVRATLEAARNLVTENRPEEAQAFLQEGLTELARRDPQIYAEVIGTLLGYRGMRRQVVRETTNWKQVTEYGLFGIPTATLLVPVPEREVVTQTLEFFR